MLKSFWFWFFVTFIAIQFIPMDVPATLKSDKKEEIEAPKEIMSILKRSCYDCHSSSSTYPWYDKIAPASWFVKNHVKNGRKVVNFSKWKSYNDEKKFKVMDKLPKSIVIRMPMPSYLWLHKDATLSSDEKKLLKKWAENLKENIK
jgi:hypothetical protein